jgi:hypothetical protein
MPNSVDEKQPQHTAADGAGFGSVFENIGFTSCSVHKIFP